MNASAAEARQQKASHSGRFRLSVAVTLFSLVATLIAAAPLQANAAGDPVRLNAPLPDDADVVSFSIVAGGDYVVYTVRGTGVTDYYSIPIGGGPRHQLNPPGSELNSGARPSIDSEVVAFVIGNLGNEQVWTANVRTGERNYITDGPNNETVAADIAISSDDKWIAVLRHGLPSTLTVYPTGGGAGIAVGPALDPGESGPRNIRFVPDGSHLLYEMSGDAGRRLFSYNPATTDRYALSPWVQHNIEQVTVLDDSRTVLYWRNRSVVSVDIDGANRTTLYTAPSGEQIDFYIVAPTNDRMAIRTDNDLKLKLRIAHIGVPESAKTIASTSGKMGVGPITPDGLRILYSIDETRTHYELYSIAMTGGEATLMLEPAYRRSATDLSISNDSMTLFFAFVDDELTEEPRAVPLLGGPVRTLVDDWADRDHLSLVDPYKLGGDLLFRADMGDRSNMFRVPTTGGPAELLTNPSQDAGVRSVAMSPNGQYLVYIGGDWQFDQHELFSVDIAYRCNSKVATIVGTPAADTITGTDGRDVIVARAGADSIDSGRGRDTICAGAGKDYVESGTGGDWVDAGTGSDVVFGEGGDDTLFGAAGNDKLRGKGGSDNLRGSAGDDDLGGGSGIDVCRGGAGVDTATTCEDLAGVP